MRSLSQNKIVAIMAAVLILAVAAVLAVSVNADPSDVTKAMAVAVLALVPAAMIPFIIFKIGKTATPPEQPSSEAEEYLMPLEETKEERTVGKGPSSQ